MGQSRPVSAVRCPLASWTKAARHKERTGAGREGNARSRPLVNTLSLVELNTMARISGSAEAALMSRWSSRHILCGGSVKGVCNQRLLPTLMLMLMLTLMPMTLR